MVTKGRVVGSLARASQLPGRLAEQGRKLSINSKQFRFICGCPELGGDTECDFALVLIDSI